MSKYQRNYREIKEHWEDQIEFIQESLISFDNGKEKEARRIAVAIRIMFHDTAKSSSIYRQLDKDIIFKLLSDLYSPANLLSSWGLLQLHMSPEGFAYLANLDESSRERIFFMTFDDWWNQIVFDDKSHYFTRRDIIMFVANKDGGAHVDSEISESYSKLLYYNSIGWVDQNGNPPLNNPLYQAIRVIAQEIIDSIQLDNFSTRRTTYIRKGHDIEVRFVNEGEKKRYIWSNTEINSSSETQSIVNGHRQEKRTLNIKEYGDKNKIKVEYIGE